MSYDKSYATCAAGHEVLAGQPLSMCPVCKKPHGWGVPWKWEDGGLFLNGQRLCGECENGPFLPESHSDIYLSIRTDE